MKTINPKAFIDRDLIQMRNGARMTDAATLSTIILPGSANGLARPVANVSKAQGAYAATPRYGRTGAPSRASNAE